MLKIAEIKDIFHDDDYKILTKISSKLPQEFLDAEIPDQDRIKTEAWAIIKMASGEVERRFPIATPQLALLSHYYLEEQKDEMPKQLYKEAAESIQQALKAFNLTSYIEKTAEDKEKVEIQPEPTKKEISLEDLKTVWKNDILKTIGEGKNGVLEAIAKFNRLYEKLDPDERFSTARIIVDAAKRAGVAIPRESILYKYRMLDTQKLSKTAKSQILARLYHYPQEIRKVAMELRNDLDKVEPMYAALEVYRLDKLAGITRRYGIDLTDPFISFFAGSQRSSSKAAPPHIIKKLAEVIDPKKLELAKKDFDAFYNSLSPHAQEAVKKIIS